MSTCAYCVWLLAFSSCSRFEIFFFWGIRKGQRCVRVRKCLLPGFYHQPYDFSPRGLSFSFLLSEVECTVRLLFAVPLAVVCCCSRGGWASVSEGVVCRCRVLFVSLFVVYLSVQYWHSSASVSLRVCLLAPFLFSCHLSTLSSRATCNRCDQDRGRRPTRIPKEEGNVHHAIDTRSPSVGSADS